MGSALNLLRTCLIAVVAFAAFRAEGADDLYNDARFWRVEREGTAPSFILGTMHVTDPAVTMLPPEVEQAFDGAQALAVELTMDPTTQATLARAMMTSDPAWMDRRLDDRQRKLLADAAGHYDLNVNQLRLLEPWAVATMFSFPPSELQRQISGEQPLDMRLMDRAEAAGKRLIALEQVEEQIDAFTGYSDQEQIDMLTRTLEGVPVIEREFNRLKDAYLEGDLAGVSAIADEGFAQLEPGLAGRLRKQLIDDRNRHMASRLEPLLNAGGLFAAVGALHLPGEDGVLNLLAQRGYRITAVR
ncbi:MAG TPA: TraB/GumN family protein [Dongiaceae bacterium]